MPNFLLEIGTEEVPARVLNKLMKEVDAGIFVFLQRYGLLDAEPDVSQTESFSTPRRIAVLAQKVRDRQPDRQEQITGPAKKIAFKDGEPTSAAHAFARKVGLETSQLKIIETPKGEYLAATLAEKGQSASDVIANELPWVIAGWPFWPKTMQWLGGEQSQRFIRPIRWIVALLDDQVVRLKFADVEAGRLTRGHRILSAREQEIPRASEYVNVMTSASVLVRYSEREHRIRKALDAATRTITGARWREDAGLLNTVVNLTEWPSAILGSFDRQFLSLPEEVLVTVMRDHQKYFAVEDASGKLAPHFLAVLNTDGDPDGLIRHGNERVLRARFNDARFFWDTDQKVPLTSRVEMLKAVTFQKDLGSYAAKTDRMLKLVENLCGALAKAGLEIDVSAAQQAAKLAKTDLTTELVKEFTELQGIIGGLYAKAQGVPQAVADAIYDQYKPESMEDSVPSTLEGAVLSIADKADSIAGMFALGLLPSGSKDPFALRRQANGIVKTIAEHKLPVNLSRLLADARAGYQGSDAEKKFTSSGDSYTQAVSSFFRERLEFYLRDSLGLAYDVVNATLAAGAEDVVDAVARAQAVAKVRPSDDFESISVAFKRMKNILRQAAENQRRVADPFQTAALKDAEEKKLAAMIPEIANSVQAFRAARHYEAALTEISKLRPAVDAFFDKVMVMVEDDELRANRLGLLKSLVQEFSSIAEFSEIVTEKK